MKRRKWQKAVAMLAGVMMVCGLPGVENLVETSSFVRAESDPDGVFSDGEMQVQETEVLSRYSEADVWSSGEEESLFSSGDVNSSPVEMVPDTSESEAGTTSDPMQVSVTLTSEVQDKKEQGEAQWIGIHAEDVSQAFEGESRVRIHLYNNIDGSPADDLEVLLFNEKQENIPETAVLPPVVLEGALNGAEELTVSRKQIYQQDENGTILLDGNGEQIVTDDYLEFTLPAGKKADFYAALLYRNQEEIYSYDALLNTEALQKVNETWRSVLNWNEAAEVTVGWANQETAENTPEEQAAEQEVSDGENLETEDSVSQIFADGEDESESGQENGNAAEEIADEEVSDDEKSSETADDSSEETGNSEETNDSSEEPDSSEETEDSLEETDSLEEPETSEKDGSLEEPDSKEEEDAEESETSEEEADLDETESTEEENSLDEIDGLKEEDDSERSRILVTMTKELGAGPEESMTNEPTVSEETKEEDAGVFQEFDTDTAERIEETAVSGQTYAVHVQAQDLQPKAKYDSVVTIHLTDLATGLPATDVATAICLSKEAAIASEAAFETELPEAVQTPAGVQNLKVARIQETAENENGENVVTADYLQFTLPAGSSADFYLGLTYTTEEADYNKQLILDVKAVQYVPIQETGEPSVSNDADDTADTSPNLNTADDTYEEELLTDESSAPTDAAQELLSAPAGIACTELVGLGSFGDSQGQDTEVFMLQADESGDTSADNTDDNNLKAVDVAVGTQAMTLLWASALQAGEPSVRANGASRFTAEETKKLIAYLEDHPDYVLLDTTNSSGYSVNWNNGNSGNLYCSIHVGNSDWFAQTENNVEGVSNIWAFDLGTGNDSADMDFGYSNVWGSANGKNGNNGTALWKTETKKVSAWKGKLLQITGTVSGSGTDDNGVLHYTVAEAVFDKSPLSGKVVYLDVTNADSMTAPPKVKIIEPDGTVTYKEMTLCPEETSVYSYRFDSYVLPDTTFQFVDQNEESAVPAAAVSDFEKTAPCYSVELDQWIPYSPKISTVKIHVQHDFSEGITVVFTKDGKETGETIVTPTDSTFDFGLYSDKYDGFYVRKASGENYNISGNSTVTAGREDVRAAADMYETTELKAWVGSWIDNDTRRAISFAPYGTDGDSSLNIPVGTFTRNSDVLYVKSTFYDYYSDLELQGKNRSRYGSDTPDSSNGSNDKVQARTFNSAISSYFSSTGLASGTRPSPLYFGEFTNAGTSGLTNFVWENNNGEPNRVSGAAAARQGLVDTVLTDGQLTMGGVIAPYFSESFLRGGNSAGTNIGYVFPEVEFPFVKNSSGYWEFDSYNSSQTLRMKRDPSGFYFLDQVGAANAVKGHTSSTVTNNSNFFPFNDKEQSGLWGKLNYAFGARLDIPFLMTADGTVDLGNGQEHIVFDFSGDDDVWIFIDGQLVLDIGGDHGAVSGKIDFNTCTATTTTKDTAADGCLSGSYTFDKSLVDPSREHTLTMFYMERGLWESNMKITFNFPQSNELEVEKEVVIPNGVNTLFADAIKKLSTIEFPISIENLATSYAHVDISGVQPAIEKAADLITSVTSARLDTPKTSAVCQVGTYGGRSEVLKYYYPGTKNYTDGQNVTDARSIYIDTDLTFDSPDQIKEEGYIQLDTYVDSSVSATDPFVALIDNDGNRVGGWISGSAYDSASKSMGSRVWKTLRIVIDKLPQLDGSTFDYGHIKQIQFSYHANVNIYIDNIYIKAAPQYLTSSGFTKDDDKIPDYDSRLEPYQLQPVNGAEYIDNRTGESSHVTDGHIYLKDKDKVTFSDQFRRNSYLKLEETVDSNVFDTSWLLYEDGALMESGSGAVPYDGLTAQESDGMDITNPAKPDDTILFMSKTRSLTDYFVKTVKYVNTLKLGSISIEKALNPINGEIPDNTDNDGNQKEYTFKIYFSNVAGMLLESPENTYLEKTVTITPGSENKAVISGIPVGTQYIIQEVTKNNAAESGFTLVSAERTSGDDGYEIDPVTYQVTGTVGGTATDEYRFTNDVRPSREIEGEKIWSNWDEIPDDERPAAIEVKLQAVWSDDEQHYPASTLIYNPESVDEEYLSHLCMEPASDILGNPVPSVKVSDETDWKYQFTKLPTIKYLSDGTETDLYYRVVETKVYGSAYDEDGTPIGETQLSGVFEYDRTTDTYNVENTWWDGIDLRVVKADEKNIVTDANNVVFISGVTFVLYRQYPAEDKRLEEIDPDVIFACDSSNNPNNRIGFPAEDPDGPHYKYVKIGQETTDHEGNIDFKKLQNGTYYLKEESVPEGYVNPGNLWTVFKLEPGLGTQQFVEINGVRQTGFPGWSVADATWNGEGFLWVPDSSEDYDMYLPIHNTLMRTVLEITKVDANDNTKKLSGITFAFIKQFVPEVERDENGDPVMDADGNPIYSKDEYGEYIYPNEAEHGWYTLENTVVSNAGLPESFKGTVKAADGTETTEEIPYKYVCFEEQETDESGWVAFVGAEYIETDDYSTSYWGYGNGIYYLVEEGVVQSDNSYFAPEGYNMLAEPLRIEIRRGGSPSVLVTGSGLIGDPVMTTEEDTYEYHPDEYDPDYTVTFTGCRITMTVGDPPAPDLQITKTDQDDPAMKLDGAEFSLYRRYTPKVDSYEEDGTPVYKIKTKWDSSQKKNVPVLDEDGDYIYMYDKPDSAVFVKPKQDDPDTEEDESNGLPVSDVPYGYELIGTETTAAGTEENPEIAGIAAFKSLQDGTYVLVETKAPEGYEKLTGVIVLELDHTKDKWCTTDSKYVTVGDPDSDNNICKITVENPSQMYMEVEKFDQENNSLLAGAEFTLYKQGGALAEGSTEEPPVEGMEQGYVYTAAGTGITGSGDGDKGILKFEKLDNGIYYLWETTAPAGYRKAMTQPIRIEINRDDETAPVKIEGTAVAAPGETNTTPYSLEGSKITVKVENIPLSKVQITKIDSSDPDTKLSSAEFELYKEVAAGTADAVTSLPTGETGSFCKIGGTLTTDTDGKVTTDYLEPGTYYLAETKAPAVNGVTYNKLQSAVKFTVAYEDKKSSVTIVSGSGVTTGNLQETSEGTHIFAVSISDPPYTGLKIKKTGTDSTGQAVTDMSGVKFNFYRQYASSDAAKTDGIDEQSILAAGSERLAGMNLPAEPSGVVYVLIQALTTDKNSIADITNKQPDGTYYLVETEAKDGFQKLENPIKISISHAADENLTTSVTADGAVVRKDENGVYEITVANSMLNRTNLRIQKVNMKKEPLGGVEFELYQRLSPDTDDTDAKTAQELASRGINGLDENYKYKKIDAEGESTPWVTSSADGYTPYINELEDGTYCIVETKTAEGYSLLKSPIVVTLNRRAGTGTIEGLEDKPITIDSDGNLTITVTNQGTFVIPATGSWSRYIMMFGGAILAGLATIMYLLQKRRKGGITS